MSTLPMNRGAYGQPSIYGQSPDYGAPEMQDIQKQRALAERLRQQGEEQLQGQMVSGRYVAPSWTQALSKALQQGLGAYQLQQADDAEKAYNTKKAQKIADLIKGNTAQTTQQGTTETSTMPAYTPEQQDRFGSPLQGVERQPVVTSTPNMVTETPEQVQARQRTAAYQLASEYQNDPTLQLVLSDLNHQRDRLERKDDVLDQRTYEGTTHARDVAEHRDDVKNAQEFQRIMQKDQQGFALTQQERQFAQAWKLQQSNQGFQAGQNKNNQTFQATENQKNRDATRTNEILKLDAEKSKGKPLTEAQGKAVLYGTRAQEAHNILNSLEGKYSPMAINAQNSAEDVPTWLGGGLVSAAGNKMLSPENQKAIQAQRDFVTAVLRQESGATISPSEFDTARKQYFPQPGDSEDVIAQKKVNRETAIKGFGTMSSGAFNPSFQNTGAQGGWGIEVVQ